MTDEWSEKFRVAAKEWVDADAEASLAEELKSSTLNQMIIHLNVQGEMPVNRRESIVRSSDKWIEYVNDMVKKRTKANLFKVRLEYIRMRFNEQQSIEATKRAEMKL